LTKATFLSLRKLICSISSIPFANQYQQSHPFNSHGLTTKLSKVLPQLFLGVLVKVFNVPDVHIPGGSSSDGSHDGRADMSDRSSPTDLDLGVVNHQSMIGSLLEKGSRLGWIGKSDKLDKPRSSAGHPESMSIRGTYGVMLVLKIANLRY
jgi:hypothetical protein